MSEIRDVIRSILREEISALRQESARPTVTETVRISSSADLGRFVQEILARSTAPDFMASLTSGQLTFALAGISAVQTEQALCPIVSSPGPTGEVVLNKPLITEADITNLGSATRTLKVSSSSRFTPLANDEARRKGIQIERIKI